ncbi:MAG: T9SS type A sorting domain-containing protein, partial [Bacteroidetes bacterium]|nr:T9SS type A sorting domain-containing protein [Bacteroidota bacterium]
VTGSYNYFRDCYIERALGLSHWGHGYTAKTNAAQVIDQGLNLPSIPAQYNQFYYCVARNMNEAFCVRHRMAQYNLFYHCKAIGSHTGATGSSGGEGNGIVIRDGASDNIFDGCIAENCYQAIVLVDSNEDGDMGTNPPGHPNKNNKIINAVVYNSYIGISFSDSGVPSDAGENTIAGCTFYNTRYMFYAGRSCKNMKYRNNIYQGTLPATPGGAFKVGSFANDIVSNGATTGFSNCNFYNIQGGMPTGFVSGAENSISADPLFKNSAANDFHLLSGSPCINSGITLDFLKTDFDSISRPQGVAHDMGAYEFQIITSIPNTQPEKLFIRIYPNPASGILHIQTKEPGCKISIYDMAGNLIHQVTSQLNSTEIGLGKVASGMYILRAQNKRKKESEKFIVIK